MQNNTIRTIYISFLSLFLFIVYCQIDRAEARNDNTIPSRIQQVCWNNFYGVSFDWIEQNQKFARRCETLWRLWIEEEKAKFKN